RSRTREGDERKRESHEQHSEVPAPLAALTIEVVEEAVRQAQIEQSQQRKGEDYEDRADEKVNPWIRCDRLCAGCADEYRGEYTNRRKGDDDGGAIHARHPNGLRSRF